LGFVALRMAIEPKIAGVIIPRRVFTQPGSKPESLPNARMSAFAGCGHACRDFGDERQRYYGRPATLIIRAARERHGRP
jgi:hypothetical protein